MSSKDNIMKAALVYLGIYIGCMVVLLVQQKINEEENYQKIRGPLITLLSGAGFVFGCLLLLLFRFHRKGIIICLSLYILFLLFVAGWIKAISYHTNENIQKKTAVKCSVIFNSDKMYDYLSNWGYLIFFYGIVFYVIYIYFSGTPRAGAYEFLLLLPALFIGFFLVLLIDLFLGWSLRGDDSSYIDAIDIYDRWISGENNRSGWKIFWRVIGLIILIYIPYGLSKYICKNSDTGLRGITLIQYSQKFLCKSKSYATVVILSIILLILILPLIVRYVFSDECFIKSIEDSVKGYQMKHFRLSCIIQKYGGLHNIHLFMIFGLALIIHFNKNIN